jgi:hypothetical protein
MFNATMSMYLLNSCCADLMASLAKKHTPQPASDLANDARKLALPGRLQDSSATVQMPTQNTAGAGDMAANGCPTSYVLHGLGYPEKLENRICTSPEE